MTAPDRIYNAIRRAVEDRNLTITIFGQEKGLVIAVGAHKFGVEWDILEGTDSPDYVLEFTLHEVLKLHDAQAMPKRWP